MDFSNYSPIHALELVELLETEPWQRLLQSPEIIERARSEKITPAKPCSPENNVVEQLVLFNEQMEKSDRC